MAEVVGRQVGKVVSLHKAFEVVGDGVRHPRSKEVICGGEHESRGEVRVWVLPLREFLILLEGIEHAWNDGNGSRAVCGFRCADDCARLRGVCDVPFDG